MDRLVLKRSVWVEGRDYKGRRSTLVLSPASGHDWLWRIKGVGDVPITPDMLHAGFRCVSMRYKEHVFNEVEHTITPLRVAGMRGVVVELLGSTWPPFDGCAMSLWNAVMPGEYVAREGLLKPYHVRQCFTAEHPGNAKRTVRYVTTDEPKLRLRVEIDYPGVGGTIAHCCPHEHSDREDGHLPMVECRTLAWPPFGMPYGVMRSGLRLASKLGWPHFERLVWVDPYSGRSHKDELVEIAYHRMLDMLVMTFAAPADSYLCGMLTSFHGGHAGDIALLRQLAAQRPTGKVIKFPAAA